MRAHEEIDAGVDVSELPKAGEGNVVRPGCVGLGGQCAQAGGVAGGCVQEEERAEVFGVGEAFLGESEIPSGEGGVANSFPAVLDVGFAGDFKGDGEVIESKGEVKAVLRIGGNIERHFFVALAFEKTCDFILLISRNVLEEFGRCFHVSSKH